MTPGFVRAVAAAALVAAVAFAAPASAKDRHHRRPTLQPDIATMPYGMAPPPQMLYPAPQSTATVPLPQVRSQVPVGRAGPGVTPYELLPNRP
jgi:hypothetical protein